MKNRIDQWITVVAFCAFIGIMSLLYLVLPKQETSELEKRPLEKAPEFSMEALTSGELGSDIETYMSDHIPGRSFFVGLNSYVDLYTGRQVTKDVYLAEGDRLVEAPAKWNQEQVDKNMKMVNRFAETLGKEVDFMIVPSGGWASQDLIQGVSYDYKDETYIGWLYSKAAEGVNCVDVMDVYEGREDLYYRTDHHWTSEGAYKGYAAYMDAKGRAYPTVEDFKVTVAKDFTGSTYTRAGLWMIPGENVEMWECTPNLQVTNENGQPHDGLFYLENLQELDKYTVFLDGNHATVTIHNPNNVGKGNLLVIRDSYSNCLGGFLAESYENVVMIDLRNIMPGMVVSELDAQYDFADVLVCYSLSNFLTDNNLIKLK